MVTCGGSRGEVIDDKKVIKVFFRLDSLLFAITTNIAGIKTKQQDWGRGR